MRLQIRAASGKLDGPLHRAVRSRGIARPFGRLASRACLSKIALASAGCFLANIHVLAAQPETMPASAATPFYSVALQQNEGTVSEPYLAAKDALEANRPYLGEYWLEDEARRAASMITLRYGWHEVEVEGALAKKKKRGFDHLHIDAPRLFGVASKRLSYRPNPNWLLQISRKRLGWLDQMSLDSSIRRTMVSATYSRSFSGSLWETILAYGRSVKKTDGGTGNSYLIESLWQINNAHTLFGKLERAAADELFSEREALYGQTFNANKLTLGYVHDFMPAGRIRFGIGGLASKRFVSQSQAAMLGADSVSYKVFMRLVLSYP